MNNGHPGKKRNIRRCPKPDDKRRRKSKWIGHVLRGNCLQKHVIEGKIQGRIK